jgi:opacity protein-like surface antigen
MKKLILTMVLVLVMMPFASFAKTVISDSDLGVVTAQSGVSISFASLNVSGVNVTIQSWGDTDGFTAGGYTTQGWVGAAMTMTGNVVGLSGTMNIDVGTSGTQTRLKVDLPTVVIGAGAGLTQDQTIKLSSAKTLDATGFGTLGQSYVAGLTATIQGSVQIYAH